MSNISKMQIDRIEFVKTLKELAKKFLILAKDHDYDVLYNNFKVLEQIQDELNIVIKIFGLDKYKELVSNMLAFMEEIDSKDNLVYNIEEFKSILLQICDIAEVIENKKLKKCSCCGNEVFYSPLPYYYESTQSKYGCDPHIMETLNKEEYICPCCGASDRDRLIVSFLEKTGIKDAMGEETLLHFAPARAIEYWIHRNCPGIGYLSTDLFMDAVSFKSDIQDMYMIEDDTIDYFVCSHVLEHVQNDIKALQELYRILKKRGFGVFLVPIALDVNDIEEEWGCSEEENWRRFGHGDYCRLYSKEGLLSRIRSAGFHIIQLGKEYFGEELFEMCGMGENAVLYILTKEEVRLDKHLQCIKDRREKRKEEAPLVSVILPTFNHEKYVSEAVESVINQTYSNIEFIVADDGSTDGTVKELLKYEDKIDQIHLFDQNTNGKTFQFLTSIATGKYIAIMHSDDVWDTSKIELQVDYLENHPEVGACFTGVMCINENDQCLGEGPFILDNMKKEEWIHFLFEKGNCFCHPSVMMRTDLYSALINSQNKQALRQLPDMQMWLNLLVDEEIHIIERSLVYFRWHNDTNENTSLPNTVNNTRVYNELNYIWYSFIKNMDADLFKMIFANEVIDKDMATECEIMCEKLFVLMKKYKRAAIQYAFEIVSLNEDVLNVMEEKYNFLKQQLYDLTATSC